MEKLPTKKYANLDKYAKEMKELHGGFVTAIFDAKDKAVKIGELLVICRQKVEHGDWEKWVKDNCDFSLQMARRYQDAWANRELLLSNRSSRAEIDIEWKRIMGNKPQEKQEVKLLPTKGSKAKEEEDDYVEATEVEEDVTEVIKTLSYDVKKDLMPVKEHWIFYHYPNMKLERDEKGRPIRDAKGGEIKKSKRSPEEQKIIDSIYEDEIKRGILETDIIREACEAYDVAGGELKAYDRVEIELTIRFIKEK